MSQQRIELLTQRRKQIEKDNARIRITNNGLLEDIRDRLQEIDALRQQLSVNNEIIIQNNREFRQCGIELRELVKQIV